MVGAQLAGFILAILEVLLDGDGILEILEVPIVHGVQLVIVELGDGIPLPAFRTQALAHFHHDVAFFL